MFKLSVVIPTLNRADVLATTIDRIEHQTVGRETYEVIVIDNNSSDHTQNVLAEKTARYSNLRTFFQSKPGAAATRNVGIKKATGDLVLFIDDDIFSEPRLVEAHLGYHSKNSKVAIIGEISSPWEESTDPFLRYLRDKGIFNPYSIACGRPMDFSYYHTGNVSTSARLLREAGGFSEEFSVYGMEDIELGYRLERKGCRMAPGPAAKARHEYYPTYEQFVRRCEQAGYSLGKMIQLHPELGKRFVENGKYTRLLRRFHGIYRVMLNAASPLYRNLIRWESRRGTGAVTTALDQHYYWAIRYHFFVGYREYIQNGRINKGPPVLRRAGQRIPKLAIERNE